MARPISILFRQDGLDDVDRDVDKFGTGMLATAKKLAAGFAAAWVTQKVGERIGEALNIDAATDKMQAQLGLTGKRAGELGVLAGQTYAGAWGESLEEVQGFYAATMRAFPDLTDAALKRVTESAATTSDLWDQDFNEVVRAAQQLLVNGLAPDAQTAMDMVATALQKTKGPTDEVIAAIDEYANHFGQLGLDGTHILGALTSKWATNQYAIDKVGDAIKEMGIRVIDGSDTTRTALGELGLSVAEVEAAYAKGGDTAEAMTKKIINGILGIEDPAERARVGVALMGTPFEDLGKNAVPILRDVVKGQDNLTDSVKLSQTAYDNAKTRIESFQREGLMRLTKFIGNVAVPAIEGLIDEFDDAVSVLTDGSGEVSNAVANHLGVKVPDTLSASGSSWKVYANRVDRAKRDSIGSFSDLSSTITSRSLTFGEKFGLIWEDLWDENQREQRNKSRIMRGLWFGLTNDVIGRATSFAGNMLRHWRKLWTDAEHRKRTFRNTALAVADSWTGGMVTRTINWRNRMWPQVRDLYNQMGTRTRTALGDMLQRFARFVVDTRQRIATWGFVMPLLFRRILNDVVDGVRDRLRRVVQFFWDLPGRIANAVRNLGSTVKRTITNVLKGITANIKINLGFGGDGLGIGGLGRLGGSLLGVSANSAVGRAYSSMGRPGDVISGFRPGSRTLSGNLSYHARGRALDITPQIAIAHAIRNRFGRRTLELITPWPSLNLHHGRPHRYSDAVQAQHDGRTNVRHIHWAMATGAYLRRPFEGIVQMAERHPEIVSPEPMLREIVRTESGKPVIHVAVYVGDEQLDARMVRVTTNVLSDRARRQQVFAAKGGRP